MNKNNTKKITLLGINSKFVHTNLALRYIKKIIEPLDNYNTTLIESSINNQIPNIIRKVIESEPEILLISTYIWNKEFVFKIIPEIKKIEPKIKIYLGGPEVSYDAPKIMAEYTELEGVLIGEGEKVIKNLFTKPSKEVLGLYYRGINGSISFNGPEEPIKNLDIIPFPYDKSELIEKNGKIFYYESSRGCPFQCSYCMSSIEKSVRTFSLERVKKDLMFFLEAKVKLVKFIDRTFNLKKEYYMEIWKFLVKNYIEGTTFHFEISGDLFDAETIKYLKTIPKGLFQFEVGVQTINNETMELIHRKNNLEKLSKNILAIKDNIHLHLDLIAGLPKEDFNSFKNSFNYVYHLKPEMIQLGFLKILKGTKISEQVKKFEYKYMDFPPYEVISNTHITYKEILTLKDIEKVLDFYYNSGDFIQSIDYIIINFYTSPFDFYSDIAKFYLKNNYFEVSHKKIVFYEILLNFYKDKNFNNVKIFIEYLKYDYLTLGKPGIYPSWFISKKNKDSYHTIIETLVRKGVFKSSREGFKKTEMEELIIDIKAKKDKKTTFLFRYDTDKTTIEEC